MVIGLAPCLVNYNVFTVMTKYCIKYNSRVLIYGFIYHSVDWLLDKKLCYTHEDGSKHIERNASVCVVTCNSYIKSKCFLFSKRLTSADY